MALERGTHTAPSGQTQYLLAQAPTSRRAAGVSTEVSDASPDGAASGADLGGSSKYSNENFEGRSGEGFHVNSS
jgi:hypothetical protein